MKMVLIIVKLCPLSLSNIFYFFKEISVQVYLLISGGRGLLLSRKQRKCMKNDDFDIQDKLYIQMNLAELSHLRHCI